jgi:hypothetical protein
MFWLPSKKPTPSEWAVLFYSFCILLIVAGIAGLSVSLFAPPEKHEIAVALARHSSLLLASGLVIGGCAWFVRRWLD